MGSPVLAGVFECRPGAHLVLGDAAVKQVRAQAESALLGRRPVARLPVGAGVGLGSLGPSRIPLFLHARVADFTSPRRCR